VQRRGRLTGRGILFIAFAFTVMADPVSSIAYAIEAALRHLDGDLADLFLTMALVIATIAVIAATLPPADSALPRGRRRRAKRRHRLRRRLGLHPPGRPAD
jgi:hypothetical protein